MIKNSRYKIIFIFSCYVYNPWTLVTNIMMLRMKLIDIPSSLAIILLRNEYE